MFCPEVGEVAQTMYTLVSKCKNDKIKKVLISKLINFEDFSIGVTWD
jgi:hypothetical protein